MPNYYEILQIDRTADTSTIKRAYFRLVKLFSPEKKPTEFKQIREAYEVLSKKSERMIYDASLESTKGMSPQAAEAFNEALAFNNRKMYARAVQVLADAVKKYPEIELQIELAKAYIVAGNFGLAIQTAERILRTQPNNADCLHVAALASYERGWNKKAQGFIDRAVDIEPHAERHRILLMMINNLSVIYSANLYFSECEEMIQSVLSAGGKVPLLTIDLLCSLIRSKRECDEQITKYGHLLVEQTRDVCADTIAQARLELETHLFAAIVSHLKLSLLPQLRIALENLELRSLMQTPKYKMLEIGYVLYDLSTTGTPIKLTAYLYCNVLIQYKDVSPIDIGDLYDENVILECDLLMELDAVRPHILRIKKEHPDLFAFGEEFLNSALQSRLPHGLLERRLSKRSEALKRNDGYSMNWSFLGKDILSDYEREPIRAEKIGRNVPCPCGSGKKYKKCCGR